MGSVRVDYSGPNTNLSTAPGFDGTPVWDSTYTSGPPSSYTSTSWTGGWVTNAPPTSYSSVELHGGTETTETISFTSPVTDPVIAIWSLGDQTTPTVASFVFSGDFPSETVELLAGGPDAKFGGSSIAVGSSPDFLIDSQAPGATGTYVTGEEGNGTIELLGTFGNGENGFASISFTTPISEGVYDFTVGEPTPEPETLSLLGLGLLALPLLRASLARRRRA
jgi:hypothetical protein